MKLPYYQTADEFLTVDAPLIAGLLRIDLNTAVGLGVRLFAFAVDVTSDRDRAPDGVFLDPDAATILEAAVGWTGQAGALVGAFVRAKVIERLEMGLRVCGMDRYAATWTKNKRRRRGADDGRTTDGPCTAGGGKTGRETETETETEEKKQKNTAAKVITSSVKSNPPPAPTPDHYGAGLEFLAWTVEERRKAFPAAVPEERPAGWEGWVNTALSVQNGPARVRTAYRAYLADPYWRQQRQPCPWAAWAKQWAKYLPDQGPHVDVAPGVREWRELKPGEDIYAEQAERMKRGEE